jgi:LCP family protein required for cell wall assembly
MVLVLAMVLVALWTDGYLISRRVNHVNVVLPAAPVNGGQNIVILGSDSRADLPAGVGARIGNSLQVPGSRADVVLVVHEGVDGSAVTLSVPRDILIRTADGYPDRLALTLNEGPQAVVDALCRSLGIATSHLLIIDFAGFAGVVDALGGVWVDVPHPVRDPAAELRIDASGHLRLSGLQALALVRSRHPQQLIAGKWVGMDDTDGAAQRTRWAGTVFHSLQDAASRAKTDPLLMQRLAWSVSGALTTDTRTGLGDLADLANAAGAPVDVPASPVPGSTLALQATAATTDTLAAAGITGGCTPAG